MNIAYLILAHNQPEQFKRLIARLTNEDVHFFVYIDKKADISQFEIQQDNVHFVKDRTCVNHSGFSLTWAIIKMLEIALGSGSFDYFITLSGQDYPIKTNAEIIKFLEEQKGKNCINFYHLHDGADLVGNIKRRWCFDQIGNTGLPASFQRILRGVVKVVDHFLPDRVFPKGLVPYRGSAWMALNRNTAMEVIRFVYSDKGKDLRKFFRLVKASDEIFVHTIVLNSKYADQCKFYERDINESSKNENKAYCHYIDWNPERDDPAILDISDFPVLRTSEFLFARKFETVRSSELLTAIDDNLLHWHASAAR